MLGDVLKHSNLACFSGPNFSISFGMVEPIPKLVRFKLESQPKCLFRYLLSGETASSTMKPLRLSSFARTSFNTFSRTSTTSKRDSFSLWAAQGVFFVFWNCTLLSIRTWEIVSQSRRTTSNQYKTIRSETPTSQSFAHNAAMENKDALEDETRSCLSPNRASPLVVRDAPLTLNPRRAPPQRASPRERPMVAQFSAQWFSEITNLSAQDLRDVLDGDVLIYRSLDVWGIEMCYKCNTNSGALIARQRNGTLAISERWSDF